MIFSFAISLASAFSLPVADSASSSAANSVAQIRLEHLPVRLNFGGGAFGEHLALDHADHVRAELHDEVHVVFDDHEAAPLGPVELDQQFAQLVDKTRIDAGA